MGLMGTGQNRRAGTLRLPEVVQVGGDWTDGDGNVWRTYAKASDPGGPTIDVHTRGAGYRRKAPGDQTAATAAQRFAGYL